MACGEAQLPERRGREPDFEKIEVEEAAENARGIYWNNLHSDAQLPQFDH